jgi:hypothetical protein
MTTLPSSRRYEQYSRHARLVALAAAALLLSIPIESAADPREQEQRRATFLIEGAEAIRNGQPLLAIAKWRAAWAISPNYLLACDIGTAESKYGSPREGAEFLALCLREHPSSPEDAERIEKLRTKLRSAQQQVATLSLPVSEPGASVWINGRPIAPSALNEIFLDPGTYTIAAKRRGYAGKEVVVTVAKGESRTIPITLAKLPPPKHAPLAPAPEPLPNAPRASGGLSGSRLPIAVAGAALAGVGLGLGVGFTVLKDNAGEARSSRESEMSYQFKVDCQLDLHHRACGEYISAEAARLDYGRGATVSFMGAWFAAVATAVYVVYPRAVVKPPRRDGSIVLETTW